MQAWELLLALLGWQGGLKKQNNFMDEQVEFTIHNIVVTEEILKGIKVLS